MTLAAAALGAIPPASAQPRDFEGPSHQGMSVSYCGAEDGTCGERMAFAWCRTQGFEQASQWAARAGADGTRAVRLDDGSVCRGTTCESFARITCIGEGEMPAMPALGAAAHATVLSPSRRPAEAALGSAAFELLIPGCFRREPGVFVCDSIYEYEHCRTLMISRIVFSCRAGVAFASGFAEPREAAPAEYSLSVKSKAEVRVSRGSRGYGQTKGAVKAEILFDPPRDQGAWCVRREPYVYFTTGPQGGLSEIGEAAPCGEPISFSFEPHRDDILRAYDLCESFDAWGDKLMDSIDVLAASLFEMRSASPAFRARHGGDSAVIAPYVHVKAPLTIDCRVR